jgi:hypothetical protein
VFGDDLYAAFREGQALFDPDNRLNPGVMVDAAPITVGLRDPALRPRRRCAPTSRSRAGCAPPPTAASASAPAARPARA